MALPALVLVLAAALGALQLGVDQVRCVDAARSAARQLARGDPPSAARGRALAAAPDGARLVLEVRGGTVRAVVTAPVPALLRALPGVTGPAAVADAVLEGTP